MPLYSRPVRPTWPVLLAGVALLLGSCRPNIERPPLDESDPHAEAALRELGRSMFDVLSFRTAGHEDVTLRDSFRSGTSLRLLHFDAEIRYTRDVRVRSRAETLRRLLEPDATTKEIERDVTLRRLLGAGPHPSASTQVLEGSAVFEEVESGWRFVAVDRRLRLARD